MDKNICEKINYRGKCRDMGKNVITKAFLENRVKAICYSNKLQKYETMRVNYNNDNSNKFVDGMYNFQEIDISTSLSIQILVRTTKYTIISIMSCHYKSVKFLVSNTPSQEKRFKKDFNMTNRQTKNRVLTYNFWNDDKMKLFADCIDITLSKLTKDKYIIGSINIVNCYLDSLTANQLIINKEREEREKRQSKESKELDKKLNEEYKERRVKADKKVDGLMDGFNNHPYKEKLIIKLKAINHFTDLYKKAQQDNEEDVMKGLRERLKIKLSIFNAMLTELSFKFDREVEGYQDLHIVFNTRFISGNSIKAMAANYISSVLLDNCYTNDIFIMKSKDELSFDAGNKLYKQTFSINKEDRNKVVILIKSIQEEIRKGTNFFKVCDIK